MDFKDYYATLGVSPEAEIDVIKRAYRKLARLYHPDVSKEPLAEKHFKEINEAWEVLKDPQKRTQYDQLRTHPQNVHSSKGFSSRSDNFSAENFTDFSDFFNSLFGSQMHETGFHRATVPQDLYVKMHIPLSLAYSGGNQNLQLQIPNHKNYKTKNLQVKIPPGVTTGSQIRLKGQGKEGAGKAGDLFIEIIIEPHPFFSLHQKDVHLKLPITPWEAALGATLSVPTLGGNVNLKIPAHAHSGQKLRLKGRGLPGPPNGDQYVILQMVTPKADSEKTKQFYQEMAKLMPFNPREKWGDHNVI